MMRRRFNLRNTLRSRRIWRISYEESWINSKKNIVKLLLVDGDKFNAITNLKPKKVLKNLLNIILRLIKPGSMRLKDWVVRSKLS